MKIGILADSHDNVNALVKAVALFNDAGTGLVLHAGDFISPFTALPLKKLECPFTGVFGNNDGDRPALLDVFQGRVHRSPHALEIEGKEVLLMHEPDCLAAISAGGLYHAVIFGHTHSAEVINRGGLLINPGECGGWVSGERTVALWDTADDSVAVLPV